MNPKLPRQSREQSRDRAGAVSSRAGAVSSRAGAEPSRSPEPSGEDRSRPTPDRSGDNPNRSLTVAAPNEDQSQARQQVASTSAKPGLPPPPSGPRAYFITFNCYGTWFHGDAAGSVDRQHNVYRTQVVPPDPAREAAERARLSQPPYELNSVRRDLVLAAIKEVCAHRGWWLFAAHARTEHVHVIIQAGDPPEKVMNDLKAYASRHFNEANLDGPGCKRWARHGSTRYLWQQRNLESAIHYVLHEQGEPMAVYAAPGVTRPRGSEPRA